MADRRCARRGRGRGLAVGWRSSLAVSATEPRQRSLRSSNGTAPSPVTFQAETGTAARTWYGIVVGSTATSAVISNAIVEAAWYGVYAEAPGAALSIQDTTFRDFATGAYLARGTPALHGVTFTGGLEGLYVTGIDTSPTISRTVLTGATNWGAYVTPSGIATVTISGCTVHGNGSYGLYATSGSATATLHVVDSNVTGNGGYGVFRGGPTMTVAVSSSNVWGNGTDYSNVTPGSGAISANPLYVAAPGNLRLTSRSPSRFAGDAGQDLGALPYLGDPTSGLVGTLWEDFTAPVGTTAVPGDLTVASGVTLTLPPGAILAFADSDLMQAGTAPTKAELVVRGALAASGSARAPVAFRSGTGTVLGWWGIELVSTTAASTLAHAVIEGAERALTLGSTAANTIRDVVIDRPDYGVYGSAGTFELDAVTITSASYAGIYLRGSQGGTVTNAVVNGANWYGVWADSSLGSAVTLSIVNTTIHASAHFGLSAMGGASAPAVTVNLRNSLVTGGASGIYRAGASANVATTYSDVWGNTTNFTGAAAGTGTISANPSYVNPPWDLRLQAASLAIDAGTASGAPDRDRAGTPRPLDGDGVNGAAVDMGAYEHVPASFCGDGQADAGEACDDGVLNGTYGFCAGDCGDVLRCGDGVKNGPEECDDGSTTPGDGCSATCTAEGPPAPQPASPGGGGGCGVGGLGGGAPLLVWLVPTVLRRRRGGPARPWPSVT